MHKYHKLRSFKQSTVGLFKLANVFIRDVKEFESKVKALDSFLTRST